MSLLAVSAVRCDSSNLHFVTALLSGAQDRARVQGRLEQIRLIGLNGARLWGALQCTHAHAE